MEKGGGGLLYSPDIPLETMTFNQLMTDAFEVTCYLRSRFGKERIYLMAHSGGTPIAIMAAARATQLYHAYIGMAQITRQSESERIAYKYMIERYNIWVSKFRVIKKARFVDELFVLDIPTLVPKLEIPVYFFSGKYDLTVNIDSSKAYLKKLEAPVKGFYTFDQSAHSPLFEEPERCVEIMVSDVINGETNLSDKK